MKVDSEKLSPSELVWQDPDLVRILEVEPSLHDPLVGLIANVNFHSRYWIEMARSLSRSSARARDIADSQDRLESYYEEWGESYRTLGLAIAETNNPDFATPERVNELTLLRSEGFGVFIDRVPAGGWVKHIQQFVPAQA